MKKLIYLLALALMTFSVGCSDDDDDGGSGVTLTKILTIGDSIGTGFGVATPWPSFLESMAGVPVSNNSRASRRTGEGLALLRDAIAKAKPSHLAILLGTNDALHNQINSAAANLQAMIDIGNDAGLVVVVGTLPPIPRNSRENAASEKISNRIAGLSGARIAGVRGEVGAGNYADGIHPNSTGQRNIAAAFLDRL